MCYIRFFYTQKFNSFSFLRFEICSKETDPDVSGLGDQMYQSTTQITKFC